jgi:hypothetical protein
MSEAEWLAYEDAEPILKHLRSHPEKRRWRLFAAACCRRTWRMLDEGMRIGVDDTERSVAITTSCPVAPRSGPIRPANRAARSSR